MNEKLIVSLDLHGVIDHDVEFFKEMATDILAIGGKVFVISGSIQKEIDEELASLNFPYTEAFSITDFLIDTCREEYVLDKYGRPSFDIEAWNSGKAELIKYLDFEEIFITHHYDDTLAYRKYFPEHVQFYWYKKGKVLLV